MVWDGRNGQAHPEPKTVAAERAHTPLFSSHSAWSLVGQTSKSTELYHMTCEVVIRIWVSAATGHSSRNLNLNGHHEETISK